MRDTVVVGDDIAIKARRFVIATGSSPALPPIPGLRETPHLTNETVFELTERPEHLIVIGAGPVGLELAQAFRRLGSAVTVLEAGQPLAREDPECAQVVLDALAREGIDAAYQHRRCARAGCKRTRERRRSRRKAARRASPAAISWLQPAVAPMSRVSASTGPASARTARASSSTGACKTTNRRVYAIGDVAGGPQFTHVANYHAGLVIRNALFRLPEGQ